MRRAHPWLKRPDVAASKALDRPDVCAALEELREDIAARAGVKPADVIRGLAAVAFGDIRRLYDAEGRLLPPNEWPDDAAAQVAGFEVEELREDGQVVGRVRKVKRYDRVRALEALARHPAVFPQAAELDRAAQGTSVFNIQINIGGGR